MKDSTNLSGLSSRFSWNSVFPDLLWIIFWLVIIYLSRDLIKTAISSLLYRLKHGVGIKIGSFELQELKVVGGKKIQNNNFKTTKDLDGSKEKERSNFYASQRGAPLLARICNPCPF